MAAPFLEIGKAGWLGGESGPGRCPRGGAVMAMSWWSCCRLSLSRRPFPSSGRRPFPAPGPQEAPCKGPASFLGAPAAPPTPPLLAPLEALGSLRLGPQQ